MSLTVLAAALTFGAAGSGWDRPFDGAEFIPADVDFFIHINEPASVRDRLAHRGIDLSAGDALPGAAMMDAWRALAQSAGLSERALFDDLLGQGVTFAFRRGEFERIDWVAIASIDDDAWADFTRRLDLRIGAPVHGIAIHSLHEQELAFARLAPMVIAGPRSAVKGGLLAESLALASGAANLSLARDEALAPALKLGDGEIGLFTRHAPPLGGSSVVVGDLGRDLFVARHASAFVNSPFGDSPRPTSISRALFDALAEDSTCVLAQPLEMPTGALAAFLRARLPQGALTPAVEENLGERLVWIILERPPPAAEPVQQPGLLDLVLAVEMRDASTATAQADALWSGLSQVFNNLIPAAADEHPRPALPDFSQLPPDAVRRIDIGPALARLYPRLVDPAAVSLNWTTVSGSQGTWWVVGTGGEAISRVATTLLIDPPIAEATADRTIDLDWQFGMVRGPQAAAHIARLGALASDGGNARDEGDHADAPAIDGITAFLSSALGAADRCFWKAELPGQNRVRSTWVFYLKGESPRSR